MFNQGCTLASFEMDFTVRIWELHRSTRMSILERSSESKHGPVNIIDIVIRKGSGIILKTASLYGIAALFMVDFCPRRLCYVTVT